jgi:hypothetical protein
MTWFLRLCLVVMSYLGYGHGMPLWWLPAFAAGSSVVADVLSRTALFLGRTPVGNLLFFFAKVFTNTGTIVLLACPLLLIYWLTL